MRVVLTNGLDIRPTKGLSISCLLAVFGVCILLAGITMEKWNPPPDLLDGLALAFWKILFLAAGVGALVASVSLWLWGIIRDSGELTENYPPQM